MEIYQCRYFVALCRTLNFTRAAKQCRVSQPSLSNGIMALERELGGALFERSPIALTPLGRRLRRHLEAVLCDIERIHKSARGYQRQRARQQPAKVRRPPGFPERPPITKDCRAIEPPQ